MTADMQEQLQAYVDANLTELYEASVSGLTSISTGWESDVYSFVLEHGQSKMREELDLILRVYPGDDAYEKSGREFEGMRRLHDAGYPVPEVMTLERDNSPFGRPFVIMELIKGQTMRTLMAEAPHQLQDDHITRLCDLMAQLHSLDWHPHANSPIDYDDSYYCIDATLGQFQGYFDRFPLPGFREVVHWLVERRDLVPCRRPSVIHLDFHTDNILVGPKGNAVVIDWTQVEVSDPRMDLAWTMLLMSTQDDLRWRDFILAAYREKMGAAAEEIEYFEVLAAVKRLASVAISIEYGPAVLGMRPEAVDAMKDNAPALIKVHELLVARTGVQMPEVAAMLTSFP